jgi:hypothetical protein
MPGGLHPPLSVLNAWPSTPPPDAPTRPQAFSDVILVLWVLSLLVVSGRLVARYFYLRNLGLDDVLITLSMVGFQVESLCGIECGPFNEDTAFLTAKGLPLWTMFSHLWR